MLIKSVHLPTTSNTTNHVTQLDGSNRTRPREYGHNVHIQTRVQPRTHGDNVSMQTTPQEPRASVLTRTTIQTRRCKQTLQIQSKQYSPFPRTPGPAWPPRSPSTLPTLRPPTPQPLRQRIHEQLPTKLSPLHSRPRRPKIITMLRTRNNIPKNFPPTPTTTTLGHFPTHPHARRHGFSACWREGTPWVEFAVGPVCVGGPN